MQIFLVMFSEDGGMIVYCLIQNFIEVQKLVVEVFGVFFNCIVIDMCCMGGGFGGKEIQVVVLVCLCVVVVYYIGCLVKMCLLCMEDMQIIGKCYLFYVEYDVGFDDDGCLYGIQIDLVGNCGYLLDFFGLIVDCVMFYLDNVYFLGNVIINGYCCKINIVLNIVYCGFGGFQGMVVIEEIMDVVVCSLGKDLLEVCKFNYYGKNECNVIYYYQIVEYNLLVEMIVELEVSSEYVCCCEEICVFNVVSLVLKKGLVLILVKFGILFIVIFFNQVGVLIYIYIDGSIYLNYGGIEMGQGFNIKVVQVVVEVFQVDVECIQIIVINIDKVFNILFIVVFLGIDLNGKVVQNVVEIIKWCLVEFVVWYWKVSEEDVEFCNNQVCICELILLFEELIQQVYFGQVLLFSIGFYCMLKIFYDCEQVCGWFFYYFVYGVVCLEVVVDIFIGEYCMLCIDILYDVGDLLNLVIDIGQVEGGFVQGMGWLIMEELVWNVKGKLMISGLVSYKIFVVVDMLLDLWVKLLENCKNLEQIVFYFKVVGELLFMFGILVWCVIKDVVVSFVDYCV